MSNSTISDLEKKNLEKQGYRIVGNHSVVKVCHYTKQSLRGKDVCYKCQFYGIKSWRCVEMSPTWLCDHRCVFCWRDTKYAWPSWTGPVDEPKDIIDGCISGWRGLLTGFKGNLKVDQQRYQETTKPLHFAISLTGEPTMYPRLHEMIAELHNRKITSFLVTNGTIPEMIKKLAQKENQPPQLYVSVYGHNEEVYKKTAMPLPQNGWQRLQETLAMIGKFDRSVIRLTLTKGYNMVNPEAYGKFLSNVNMNFIELKGYMNIGHSIERLSPDAMPSHEEIIDFGKKVAEAGGFKLVDQKEGSRVALLMRDEEFDRFLKLNDGSAPFVEDTVPNDFVSTQLSSHDLNRLKAEQIKFP